MSGLIRYLELPNYLATKYKKVFHCKKTSYKVHHIKIFINFALDKVKVEMLKALFNTQGSQDINIAKCRKYCAILATMIRYQPLSTYQ